MKVQNLSIRARLYASPLLHRLLPDRLAVALASLVGRLQWRFDSKGREQARQRMATLLAGTPRAGEEDALARQHLVESRMRGIVFWRSPMQRRARFEGLERFDDAVAQGKGALVVTAHLGANSLGQTVPLGYALRSLHIVAGPWMFPPYIGYDGLRMLTLKARLVRSPGSSWVETGNGYARFEELLGKGEACVIPFDVPGTYRTDFMGKPAWLRSGVARLALATGAPLLPMFAGRDGHRLYVRIQPAIDPSEFESVEDLMPRLAQIFGDEILSRPAEREGSAFLDCLWVERSSRSRLAPRGA